MASREIGRFELRQRLGGGGQDGMGGDVHLAYDPERDSLVALKLLPLRSTDADQLQAERLGASLQQRLHPFVPAIAEVYEFKETSDFFYISMEYIEGLDLSAVLQQEPAPEKRALGIAVQLCRIVAGIQVASQNFPEQMAGVVHGDIKPENIRLEREDRVRLLDFGAAKGLAPSRNFTRNLFGTVQYLSPERVAHGIVDVQADLWAIAVVLYRMVVGRLPYPEESIEILQRHYQSGALPERPPDDRCSPALRRILLRCLAIDPARRYPSPEELLADLEAALAGRPHEPAALGEPTRRRETPPRSTPQPDRAVPPGSPPAGQPFRAPTSRTPAPPAPAPAVQRTIPPSRPSSGRGWIRWLVVLVLLVLAGSQWHVLSEAHEIRSQLAQREDRQSLLALSDRLRNALQFDLAGLGSEARDALKRSLDRAATPVLASYRGDVPTTRRDWEHAVELLRKAVSLDERDDTIQAKLAYSEGQIERLKAEALAHDRHGAQMVWQGAVQKLQDAARLAPELPDPYVALAQIYGDERYEPFEVDKLKTAVQEAERRSFRSGTREKLELIQGCLRDGWVHYYRGRERTRDREGIRDLYTARDRFEEARRWCGQVAESRAAAAPCDAASSALKVVTDALDALKQV